MTFFGSRDRSSNILLGLLLVFALLSQIWVILPHNPENSHARLINDLLIIPSSLLAGLLCGYVALQKTVLQKSWWFFAFGLFCNGLGDTAWVILQDVLKLDPYPSVADVFYLASLPSFALGLFYLPRSTLTRLELLRLLLNIGIVISSLGTILWYYLVAQMLTQGEAPIAFVVSITYPIGALILLTIILFLVLRPTNTVIRQELIWLSAGILLLAVADLGFALQGAYGTETQSSIFDSLWGWSSVCLGLAASSHLQSVPKPAIETPKSRWVLGSIFMMSAPLIAAFALVSFYIFSNHNDMGDVQHLGLNFGVMLVITLVLLRQVFMLVENRHLNSQLLLFSDELEQRIAQRTEQLEWNATHDALTGIANRVLLQQRLGQLLPLHQVAVLFIDLDGFKRINDTLGHETGDYLLKEVAQRIQNSSPHQSLVARTGGDEFVVVVQQNVHSTAQKILETLEQPFKHQNLSFSISASLGISQSPEDGTDAETLQRHADAAMYTAKNLGRGQIQVFNPQIRAHLERRFLLEQCLRSAINQQELSLNYQPIVAAQTGQLESFEALLRWSSPQLGQVSPSEFIAIAEESGLMSSITQWVIETVCVQQNLWRSLGLSLVPVSVNIPMAYIGQPELLHFIQEILTKHKLEPKFLQIELLEDALAQPHIAQSLSRLRQLGICIAIDDFGTGYSNLAYLHRLPIDCLKIAQTFMQQENSGALLEAIVALTKTLGLRLIVEGVETKKQLEQLQQLQCDAIQGYIFAAPANAVVATQWLEKRLFISEPLPHSVQAALG